VATLLKKKIKISIEHNLCLLFPYRVLRRVITLINQLAMASSTTASLQTKAESDNQTAKKYMEDNELLKQVKSYPVSLPFLHLSPYLKGSQKEEER
jgi:hypothetical protein